MHADPLDDKVAKVERVADGPALGIEKRERRGVLAVPDTDDADLVDLLQRAGERRDRRGSPRLRDSRTHHQQADKHRPIASVGGNVDRCLLAPVNTGEMCE